MMMLGLCYLRVYFRCDNISVSVYRHDQAMGPVERFGCHAPVLISIAVDHLVVLSVLYCRVLARNLPAL